MLAHRAVLLLVVARLREGPSETVHRLGTTFQYCVFCNN
jgi:hypothetical protein